MASLRAMPKPSLAKVQAQMQASARQQWALLDTLDPRAYLEQFIVDNTCEWCGETLTPYPITEDGKPLRFVPRVTRELLTRIEHRRGYRIEHRRVWRVCQRCRNGDKFGFDKFTFPLIRSMPEQDFVEQLVRIQPMQLPTADVLYMDYVYDPDRRRERDDAADRRRERDDAAEALIGGLMMAQESGSVRRVRVRRSAFNDGAVNVDIVVNKAVDSIKLDLTASENSDPRAAE